LSHSKYKLIDNPDKLTDKVLDGGISSN